MPSDHPSVNLQVPAAAGNAPADQYANFVRIGGVAAEESLLQQDPSALASGTFCQTTFTAAVLGASYTAAYEPGVLLYSRNTAQISAPNAFLRLGPQAAYETWLLHDPNATTPPSVMPPTSGEASSKFDDGLLLHTSKTMTLFAPNLVTTASNETKWSGETLHVVYDNNKVISSVQRIWPVSAAGILSNCQVQIAENYSSLVGSTASTTVGNNTTMWAGNSASFGVGAMLWSNFGVSQNIFAGQVVNITNAGIEVFGQKDAKLSDLIVTAPETISLSVAPVLAAATAASFVLTNLKALNVFIAALTSAMTVAAVTTPLAGAACHDDLATKMYQYQSEMRAATALVGVLQIMAIYAGRITTKVAGTAQLDNSSNIQITNGSIVLAAGGTTLKIDASGFRVDAGDPAKLAAALAVMAAVDVGMAGNEVVMSTVWQLCQNRDINPVNNAAVQSAADTAVADAFTPANEGALPIPSPPAIVLNSMLIKTSAVELQTGIYTP